MADRLRERRRITRYINTYANQRGVKIVKYDPATHDELIGDSKLCEGSIADEYLDTILDVIRARKNIPTRTDYQLQRVKRLQVYVATVVNREGLKVVGIVIWRDFHLDNYVYSDFKALRAKALKLRPEVLLEAFPDVNLAKLKRNVGSTGGYAYHEVLDLLESDTDYPKFDTGRAGLGPEGDLGGELSVICMKNDVQKSGIGRLLLAFAIHRMPRQYSYIISDIVKNPTQRNTKRLFREFNFHQLKAFYENAKLRIRRWPFRNGPNVNENTLFMYRDRPLSLDELEDVLSLTRINTGSVKCRTRRTPNVYTHALDGSLYAEAGDDLYCGANKGYNNVYAANFFVDR